MNQRFLRILIAAVFLMVSSVQCFAKSWVLVTKDRNSESTFWVDEQLGVKVVNNEERHLEVILRIDLQQTFVVNAVSGEYASYDWSAAKADAKTMVQNARRAAESREKFEYKKTNKNQEVNRFDAFQVVKLVRGQATEKYWIANVPDGREIAIILDKSLKYLPFQGTQFDLPFSKLGGLPVQVFNRKGVTLDLVSVAETRISQDMMVPDRSLKEVSFEEVKAGKKQH